MNVLVNTIFTKTLIWKTMLPTKTITLLEEELINCISYKSEKNCNSPCCSSSDCKIKGNYNKLYAKTMYFFTESSSQENMIVTNLLL